MSQFVDPLVSLTPIINLSKITESLDSVASLASIMDSVRQRRKEEAAATRERISEIRKRMKV